MSWSRSQRQPASRPSSRESQSRVLSHASSVASLCSNRSWIGLPSAVMAIHWVAADSPNKQPRIDRNSGSRPEATTGGTRPRNGTLGLVLLNRDQNMTNEQEQLQNLIDQGYTVEVIDPIATTFNCKYKVYRKAPIGDKTVIVDEQGKIIALQG
jgi:hypothetical protein